MAGRGSRPGERRGGRKKGTPNKLTADIRAAIEAAFDQVGGKDYLVGVAGTDPAVFCGLLGKVLPTQLQHSGKISTDKPVDRPPRETYEDWAARRQRELTTLHSIAPAGSAE